MTPKYDTLQSIVDQLSFCGYQTKDKLHSLEMNAAFVALKEMAASNSGAQTEQHPTATEPPLLECKICNEIVFPSDKFCRHCGVKF